MPCGHRRGREGTGPAYGQPLRFGRTRTEERIFERRQHQHGDRRCARRPLCLAHNAALRRHTASGVRHYSPPLPERQSDDGHAGALQLYGQSGCAAHKPPLQRAKRQHAGEPVYIQAPLQLLPAFCGRPALYQHQVALHQPHLQLLRQQAERRGQAQSHVLRQCRQEVGHGFPGRLPLRPRLLHRPVHRPFQRHALCLLPLRPVPTARLRAAHVSEKPRERRH